MVDDASEDETVAELRKIEIEVITKNKPQGVTDSWNIAYKKFVEGKFDILFLANNDKLAPKGSLEPLIELQ